MRYHQGSFVFSMPLHTHNSEGSPKSVLLTFGLLTAMHGIAYYSTKWLRGRKDNSNQKKYEVAFAFFESRRAAVDEYLHDSVR